MHWRRKWQPTPVFLPGESQGRGSLVDCRLWGHTESDTFINMGSQSKGIAVTELVNLNAIAVIGSQNDSSPMATLNHQRQDGPGYNKGQQSRSSNQNNLIYVQTCSVG